MPSLAVPCKDGCGGMQSNPRAAWCLACSRRKRGNPDHSDVCPRCKGPKPNMHAARCGACYDADRAASKMRRLDCPDCGAAMKTYTARRCQDCSRRRRTTRCFVCSICGGRKFPTSRLCRSCFLGGADGRTPGPADVVRGFDAERFRRAIEAPALEWTPELLADRTGIPASTIRSWLTGRIKPRRPELDRVLRVLQWDRCPTCHGFGEVDTGLYPNVEGRGKLTQLEARQFKAERVRAWRAKKRAEVSA